MFLTVCLLFPQDGEGCQIWFEEGPPEDPVREIVYLFEPDIESDHWEDDFSDFESD